MELWSLCSPSGQAATCLGAGEGHWGLCQVQKGQAGALLVTPGPVTKADGDSGWVAACAAGSPGMRRRGPGLRSRALAGEFAFTSRQRPHGENFYGLRQRPQPGPFDEAGRSADTGRLWKPGSRGSAARSPTQWVSRAAWGPRQGSEEQTGPSGPAGTGDCQALSFVFQVIYLQSWGLTPQREVTFHSQQLIWAVRQPGRGA